METQIADIDLIARLKILWKILNRETENGQPVSIMGLMELA